MNEIDASVEYLSGELFNEWLSQEAIYIDQSNRTVASEEHQRWAQHEHRRMMIKSMINQLLRIKS